MKFEFQFNKELYYKQITLKFDTFWAKNLRNNNIRLVWTILSFVIGGLMIRNGECLGYFMIGLGLHFFINFINYRSFYSKNKKIYFQNVDKVAIRYEEANKTYWEFHEDYFAYKDYKQDVKYQWEAFDNYSIIENTLFLDVSSTAGLSFMLGKSEVDNESWDEILALINNKIDVK